MYAHVHAYKHTFPINQTVRVARLLPPVNCDPLRTTRCDESVFPAPARFYMHLFTGNWFVIAQQRTMSQLPVSALRFEGEQYGVYSALIGVAAAAGSGECAESPLQYTVGVRDERNKIVLEFDDNESGVTSYARVVHTDYEMALVSYCSERLRSHSSGTGILSPESFCDMLKGNNTL